MKKSLTTLTLTLCMIFAFAAIAGAKYAGYATDGSLAAPGAAPSATPGYLSWGGATKLMTANGVTASLQSSAHGGYVTTTSKCGVCHSVHRATGAGASTGTIKNQFLTAGGSSCVQCHTAWGSTNSGLLVEWGNTANSGGPHAYPSRGCGICHGGGIHGGTDSAYHGMNAFMLGNSQDAVIAADLPNQVARQVVGNGQNFAGNPLVTLPVSGGNYKASDWFVNGQSGPTAVGTVPAGDIALPGTGAANMTEVQYAAARSLLTGYTCGRSGCHTNSVFGNLTWGMTYERDQSGNGMMKTTAHSSAPGANSGHPANVTNGNSCGPCHPGNAAGGYRMDVYDLAKNGSARAYGCDQCHDMVGQATNSTAFPHGNRNIAVYEWSNGTNGAAAYSDPTTMTASSGNIWMYQANIAQTGATLDTMVDPTFKVTTGAVGPNAAGDPGKIVDGACLKCHVPMDAATMQNYDVTTLRVPRHDPTGWTPPTDINAITPYGTSRNWIYLWR